jgi:hypothetical protein
MLRKIREKRFARKGFPVHFGGDRAADATKLRQSRHFCSPPPAAMASSLRPGGKATAGQSESGLLLLDLFY